MTREEVIKRLNKFAENAYGTWHDGVADIEAIDIAIQALKAEPKHGEWENHGNEWFTCSLCDWESAFAYNFCPNCGAKMYKEIEE